MDYNSIILTERLAFNQGKMRELISQNSTDFLQELDVKCQLFPNDKVFISFVHGTVINAYNLSLDFWFNFITKVSIFVYIYVFEIFFQYNNIISLSISIVI